MTVVDIDTRDVNMETMNTSTWANDSEFMQNALNNSFDFAAKKTSKKLDFLNVVFFLCVLGLPGNLLIIVVYVRKLTTSTKVYMFALAISDSALCVCGIGLTVAITDFVTVLIFHCIISASIVFSMFLLVFVSIERLIAVRRPHSFNVKAQRAKKAIIVIAAASVVFTTITTMPQLKQYKQFHRVFKMCTILTSVFVMSTCYTLLVLTLLKRHRNSKYHVTERSGPSELSSVTSTVTSTVENVTDPQETGQSNVSTNIVTSYPIPSGPSTTSGALKSASVPPNNKKVANRDSTYRNVVLLFIISVVFIACWLPEWIDSMGIYIPGDVRRVFVLNSVVNPFIYSLASAMFREDVRQFFRQTTARLSACNR